MTVLVERVQTLPLPSRSVAATPAWRRRDESPEGPHLMCRGSSPRCIPATSSKAVDENPDPQRHRVSARSISGRGQWAHESPGISAYERPSQRLRMALEQVLSDGELSELRQLLQRPYKRPSERLREALARVPDVGQPQAWDLLFEELRAARWEAAALTKAIDLVQSLLGAGSREGSVTSPGGTAYTRGKPMEDSCDEGVAFSTSHLAGDAIEDECRRRAGIDGADEDTCLHSRGRSSFWDARPPTPHEEPWRRNARADLSGAVQRASAVASDHNADADSLRHAQEALGEAIATAMSKGLMEEAELVEASRWRRELVRAFVAQVVAAARDVDLSNMAALRAAKEQLSDTIREARCHQISEADLAGAERTRRRVHNAIEDLKGSIRVFCRVRPLLPKEIEQNEPVAVRALDGMTLEVDRGGRYCGGPSGSRYEDEPVQFAFDAVFSPASQQEVFQDCSDLLQSAFDGYNVTIFAYGQTGSGKTYTMSGLVADRPGLAPQLIDEIYGIAARDAGRFGHRVVASMFELYRNDIIDLLQPPFGTGGPVTPRRKVSVRTDKDGHVHVENVTEEYCPDPAALAGVMERGTLMRKTAATAMNSESSRSHLILTVRITRTNLETGAELRGKIMLVDLAGSERLKKSHVSGDMAKEAIEINRSLTALGDVIEALTQGQASIPYRNHKLTQVLQDSLGRTAKTLMFVHCAPTRTNVEETFASLKYAARAKKITPGCNGPLTPRGSSCHGGEISASVSTSTSTTASSSVVGQRISAGAYPE
eukprot:TRINITY_DN73796_c0_g1_i1.p1 TRINITY_DN73796_c0_g1~~TRINITY_DN73796_c0_g1_i1.p1  ORF type:complete len:770 (+),score=111.89 TRINITY_DN73796_c0_g1_i1:115-2424(+)